MLLLGLCIVAWSFFGFFMGKRNAKKLKNEGSLKELPLYYGYYVALWASFPPLFILILSFLPFSIEFGASEDMRAYFPWIFLNLLALCCFFYASSRIKPNFKARKVIEGLVKFFFFITALIAILTSLGIILSLLFDALRFFEIVSLKDFFFNPQWSPQLAKKNPSQAFGILPLFSGTLLITGIALLVALPLGLFSAIYLAEFARLSTRSVCKPFLEMLAGVPTVVYGFFAVVMITPLLQNIGNLFNISVSSESALGVGIVMGIMLIPFISSLSDDVIRAVPKSLKEAALGMGATSTEAICHIVLPAAFPGIVGAVLLAFSRAIGETMIVVMAAGLSAQMTGNPLKAVTTVTVQIVNLLTGDQEFNSPQTLAAFALGLVLFVITLCLNMIALKVMRSFKEKYG
ncbi:MAG: phosphate ABC transporter permease subunit PstC [Proteobacteria bacterium]|nr:phosphate ABC transporter permease subunit PstC [Pseudomonadota bacterium]